MDPITNAMTNNVALNAKNNTYNNIKNTTNITDIMNNIKENNIDNINKNYNNLNIPLINYDSSFNNRKEMIEKLNYNNDILKNIIKENIMIKQMFIEYAKNINNM
jgi:hypothetical protein